MDTPTPSSTLPTGTWDLAPATTTTLTLKKLGFITVEAAVSVTDGTIVIDDDGSIASIEATLDAASFASGNDKRDEHVRGEDFFDTDTHPTIRFASTSAEPTADGYRVDGTLTIKGQSHSTSLLVGGLTTTAAEASFTANTTIDRTGVGVAKMPSFVISTMIDVAIDGRAQRRADS
ncbi:MAG: YceI family protein [Actinomycetota bacterium]